MDFTAHFLKSGLLTISEIEVRADKNTEYRNLISVNETVIDLLPSYRKNTREIYDCPAKKAPWRVFFIQKSYFYI